MTLEDFKEIYKDKTPVEMLDLLAEQHATWRHDAVARKGNRDSIDGGAYYANECRAMEARVEWIMGRLKDALKDHEPMKPIRYQEGRWFKTWRCSACGSTLVFRNGEDKPNYCTDCGRQVKWNA